MGQIHANWDLDEFERELGNSGWSRIIREPMKRTLRGRILFARAALSSGRPQHMSEALQQLGESQDLATIGMKTALLAQMREAETVLQFELPTTPKTRVELDGACWYHFAQSLAMSDLGRYTDALVAIGTARAFAGILGLSSRTQLLDMHIRAIENQMGRTNIAAIERELKLPMPEPRRKWATGVYVAGLLQLGEYEMAYQAAVPGSYWQHLAGALAGRKPDFDATNAYDRVAQAWLDLRSGRDVELVAELRTGTIREYARLAGAARLARVAATAQDAVRLLSDEPPQRPDQAAIWAAILLEATSRGAVLHDPLAVPGIFSDALKDLRSTFDVLNLLENIAPEGLLLASYGPQAHDETVFVRLTAVKKSLLDQEIDEFLRGYRGEHFDPKRTANLGAVIAGLERMIDAATDEGRSGAVVQWQKGHSEALWDLSAKFRAALQVGNSHCTPTQPGRKLEA